MQQPKRIRYASALIGVGILATLHAIGIPPAEWPLMLLLMALVIAVPAALAGVAHIIFHMQDRRR